MNQTSGPDTTTASGKGPGSPGDATVLIVDDEVDIAMYLASVLEDAGMQVLTAHDGRDGLEKVAEHRPDLISLDLVMPGMSGMKMLRELRRDKQWARIPVIIVTAHARDPQVRGDLDDVLSESSIMGPSLYLEKPLTPRRYLESVCKVLGLEAPTAEDAPDALRQEALDLLKNADADTLNEVVSKLRRHSG